MAENNEITLDAAEIRIKQHLDAMAERDSAFAEKYQGTPENIRKCRLYIENWVQQCKRMMFADDEIFGQAVHFFVEGLEQEITGTKATIATSGFGNDEIEAEKARISEERMEELKKIAEDRAVKEMKDSIKAEKSKKPKEDKPKAEPKPKKKRVVEESSYSMADLFGGLL